MNYSNHHLIHNYCLFDIGGQREAVCWQVIFSSHMFFVGPVQLLLVNRYCIQLGRIARRLSLVRALQSATSVAVSQAYVLEPQKSLYWYTAMISIDFAACDPYSTPAPVFVISLAGQRPRHPRQATIPHKNNR